MQPLDYVGNLIFVDHEREINLRGSLRNHANFLIRQFSENQSSHARLFPQALANQTDNRLPALILHIRQLGEIRRQSGDRLIGIHRQRHAHFRT